MTAREEPNLWQRSVGETPGWLFIGIGLSLLALTAIVPGWLSCRELAWQRDVMLEQLSRLETQQQRYAAFHAAVDAEDPVLLERLAFTVMRQKPVGKDVLVTEASFGEPILGIEGGWIDQWLREPMPVVGLDLPGYSPVNTRLTRISTGTSRLVLMLAGAAALAAGIWTSRQDDLVAKWSHLRPELLARITRVRGR